MANVAVCVYTFFQATGLMNIMELSSPTTGNYGDLHAGCWNQTTIIDTYVHDSLLSLFYPMCMKVALVAVQIIMHVWFMKVATTRCTETVDNKPVGLVKCAPNDGIEEEEGMDNTKATVKGNSLLTDETWIFRIKKNTADQTNNVLRICMNSPQNLMRFHQIRGKYPSGYFIIHCRGSANLQLSS